MKALSMMDVPQQAIAAAASQAVEERVELLLLARLRRAELLRQQVHLRERRAWRTWHARRGCGKC